MKKAIILMLTAMLIVCSLGHAETPLSVDRLMEEIDSLAEGSKSLAVAELSFEISKDKQSIYIDKPEVTGSEAYTIAYNIYDSDSNPVNYFYSMEERVAATPGYGGLFNVFVVVTDTATGEQNTQNIGWQTLSWPQSDTLTVGRATFEISPDKRSIFVDRPEIKCKSGSVTIAYNIYDSASQPVNYFYSTQKRVAATPGYDGKFNVFIVVTDTETGETNTQDIGWTVLGETPLPPQDPDAPEGAVVINGIYYGVNGVDGEDLPPADETVMYVLGGSKNLTKLDFVDEVNGIPVKRISADAFNTDMGRGCMLSCELHLPKHLTLIGDRAFKGCTGLTGSIYLPNGMQILGESVFQGCEGLTGLSLPETMEGIGSCAFMDCVHLGGSLYLPQNLEWIGNAAFMNCVRLTGSIYLPDNITGVADETFCGCTGLDGQLRFPEGLNYIGESAFAGCIHMKGSLIIPSGVTALRPTAFYGSGFDGILVLPQEMTDIGEGAFYGCANLKGSLVLPSGLDHIGEAAFAYCQGFTGNLVIPAGLGWMETGVFYECTGFNGTLELPEGMKTITKLCFAGCSGLKGVLRIPSTVISIAAGAFMNCSGFTGVPEIPRNIASIETQAFANCSGLSGWIILSTSTSLASDAFAGTGIQVNRR